jgi:hypothetical protein
MEEINYTSSSSSSSFDSEDDSEQNSLFQKGRFLKNEKRDSKKLVI